MMQQFIEKLISRLEKVLGDVNFEKATTEVNESYCDGMSYAYGDAISIVNQLVEEYKGGWIPCSERLPETHGKYLTTCIGKDIPQIRLFEGAWDSLAEVLAWMPLPSPYQPEK